jgi:hypothetical protein
MVVVDLDLIQNVGIERKVVGPVAGFEEGIHVHDERDPVRMVVADKGIEVCDVGCMVESCDGCFAMT